MNILNKVTLQSLKKNKTRTIVTIIGIILSTALICAVTTFTSSFQDYMIRSSMYSAGDWHAAQTDTSYDTFKKVSAEAEVDTAIYMQHLGYAEADGSENEYKPYIYLLGADENAQNMLPIHIISGNFPKTTSEIMLPAHLAENGGVVYKIGDTITLPLGDRVSDGFTLTQNNPLTGYGEYGDETSNEELEIRETRTYTVVGFYERPSFEEYTAPGYTAITLADKDVSEDYIYDVYFKMNNPKDVYDFIETEMPGAFVNDDLLMMYGVSDNSNFMLTFYSLIAIAIELIMLGSISLIYNAFAISVSERTKQFGLLSSVGATKKQLRKMVFFEAFSVSIIAIPIGIIVGITGIGITIMLIGDKFRSLGMPIDMKLCISPVSVLIAAVIALITVLISAWIPSKRATKISAVEAIRQNSDIKTKEKYSKTSKLTYKLFGLPGVLASKHYKRSKKRYRATVISLFMSIVLFISASAFTHYLTTSIINNVEAENYDLRYIFNTTDTSQTFGEKFLDDIKSQKSVTNAALIENYSIDAHFNLNNLTDRFKSEMEDYRYETDEETNTVPLFISLSFVDDDSFKNILKENNLNEAEYFNSEKPLGIIVDKLDGYNSEKGKFISMSVLKDGYFSLDATYQKNISGYYYVEAYTDENGEEIVKYASYDDPDDILEIAISELTSDVNLNIGQKIENTPYFLSNGMSIIYPQSLKENILPMLNEISDYTCYIQSDNHSESYTAIKNYLTENGYKTGDLYDYAQTVQERRDMILIINVFAYGFIILISLISVANVFNTISTNISLRRREFAMLKTVGMTQKGFNRMMNFECLLYGSRALIFGLPVSLAITFLIYLSVNSSFEDAFTLPLGAIGIAVLSVFAVVFITMLYSMSKIKKDNPIDALRNENL